MVELKYFLRNLAFTQTNTIGVSGGGGGGGIEIPIPFPAESISQITPIIKRQRHQPLGNLSYYTLVTHTITPIFTKKQIEAMTLRNPKSIRL